MAVKDELLAIAQDLEHASWTFNSKFLSDKAEELQSIAERMED